MRLLILIFTSLLFFSFKADKSGPWIKTKEQNVILCTRPLNYSKSSSPDSIAIREILREEISAIEAINKALYLNFKSKVTIYLYNEDEANEKIGTNQGGFASSGALYGKRIFFTYTPKLHESDLCQSFIGKHEMVHVIMLSEIGSSKTRLMSEGYANAVDWTYGCRAIDSWIDEYKKQHKMILPSDLLNKSGELPESVFYPQSGYFVRWLIARLGTDRTNKLYKTKKEHFVADYKKISGEDFSEMEKDYMNNCYENE
jgi:hypothetical protein